MAPNENPLVRLVSKPERIVAGLMSGTSVDGVDCAIVRLSGSGLALEMETLSFLSTPYPDELRDQLLRNSEDDTSSVRELSQLNFRVAHALADAVRAGINAASMTLEDLDLIGSHGHTVHHVPDAEPVAGVAIRSTLQIGDPSVLAHLLNIPVVGDIRVADMALGGQGAPLVTYADYVLLRSDTADRAVLNIGGIANVTLIQAGTGPDSVLAFDTGPGNMVIDALAQRLFGRAFDDAGGIAESGSVCEPLLTEFVNDAYYERPPPKSTGREKYGTTFVDGFLERSRHYGCSDEDTIATAAELTVATVALGIERFASFSGKTYDLVVAGGGVHNRALMKGFRSRLPEAHVTTSDALGVPADAREAIAFAIFAHETVNGWPTSMPSVTGASRPALQGKICIPSPGS